MSKRKSRSFAKIAERRRQKSATPLMRKQFGLETGADKQAENRRKLVAEHPWVAKEFAKLGLFQ